MKFESVKTIFKLTSFNLMKKHVKKIGSLTILQVFDRLAH